MDSAASKRIFLLSPATTSGRRAQMLLRDAAAFPLAARVREGGGAPIGEVFSFLSGLYFRGKLAYSLRFGDPPAGLSGSYVITSTGGLRPADEPLTIAGLRSFAEVEIDASEPRYTEPLRRSSELLAALLPEKSEVVLLGSVATGKYVNVLSPCFGERLKFPREFIGRGDMSRGGLLLRSAAAGTELEYLALSPDVVRRGARPQKLEARP